MNRDEIMAMDADALRLAIAEAKGWTEIDKGDGNLNKPFGRNPNAKYPTIMGIQYLPDYSRDIAAAWGLVEDARKRGARLVMNDTAAQYRAAFITENVNMVQEFTMPSVKYWSWEEAAPLAICRAWLLWKAATAQAS
ncbi:MAG: hypothetical protein WC710_14220 [Gallionella sp.]|jgi:hypothetical protein